MGFGGWTAEMRDTSRHTVARVPAATTPGPCGVDLDHPLQVVHVKPPPVKLLVFLPCGWFDNQRFLQMQNRQGLRQPFTGTLGSPGTPRAMRL